MGMSPIQETRGLGYFSFVQSSIVTFDQDTLTKKPKDIKICCHEMWSDILFCYSTFTSLFKFNKKKKNPVIPINEVKWNQFQLNASGDVNI